jgi:hypothetical protein
MTTIGRPLRGARLVTPLYQPRISDSRAAAAARQRAAIRNAFQPSAAATGTGSIRVGTRPQPGAPIPRTAVIPGAAPRGRIGVSSWNAVERHGGLSAKLGSLLMPTAVLFGAFFILTILSIEIATSRAKVTILVDEQTRLMEEIRVGETDMSRLGREPAVRRRVTGPGVVQLVDPLVVEVR